ncbi:Pentatricopeptide repeat-containing protein [Sesamum alatum]|uniref:Pentatricopeptide repeat-containing protein n=1 Tax=Sesamum alatum TaxID=300844 RepID=A0AAE1XJN5_9LAMI|nr:Pentatricopeptide repeat-containing protein [Sesamum alatum]
MTAAVAVSRHLHQPLSHLLSESLQIIPAIKSVLQSLNPQNPRTHQNPNPDILSQFSPYLTPNLVVQIIKDLPSPYHSLFFFTWASSPSPNPNQYRHSHFCYIAITDKLLSYKLFSLAADLLKTHCKFSDFLVGKFIKAHGDLGHLKWAVKLFHQVRREKLGDCLFSYNALLGVLVKANRVNHAWAYFGRIVVKESVVKPDVSTYTTMIRGLCKVGMIEDAEKLFDEMSCGKNLMTYNIIIDGFCKKGLVESAQRIVDQMARDEACPPDTVSYTTLIDGYCKKGEFGNAMSCFDEMVRGGNCEPNVLTYNVLINGLCLNGNVDEARRMMSRMRLSGLRDNIATHTSLLKGYCIAGRSDEAVKHFKEMLNLGMSLDGKSYAVIVNEYCKLRRPDEAIVLLREMRGRGINPSLASFNAIFRSLIKLQEFDKAILLLKQMRQWGCYPNFISYNEVIIGLVGAKGRMQDVEMLVNDMIQDGQGLDTTLYSSLIQAYCINGDVRKAAGLFKEMIDVGLVIKKECFKVFVKEFYVRGLVHEVENLFVQMRNSCPAFDVETYRSALNEYLIGNSSS